MLRKLSCAGKSVASETSGKETPKSTGKETPRTPRKRTSDKSFQTKQKKEKEKFKEDKERVAEERDKITDEGRVSFSDIGKRSDSVEGSHNLSLIHI